MTATLQAHGPTCGVARLSTALGVPRSSAYRWCRPLASSRAAIERVDTIANTTEEATANTTAVVARTPSPRALWPDTQAQVLAYLRDPRFVDRAPAQVHAVLLDEGTYVCSVRTSVGCSRPSTKCARAARSACITRLPCRAWWPRSRGRCGRGM